LAGLIPLRYRAGALTSTTNSHTPEFGVLAEDRTVVRELAEALFLNRPRRISLAFLDSEKPDLSDCRAAAARAGYRLLERTRARSPYIEIYGDWNAYEKRLGKNLRKDISRQRRRLEKMGHVSFEVFDGSERLDELLDEGFRVEALGWKGARETAIISRPNTVRFYTDIAHWAAARGWLRLIFLRLDGRSLAFQFDLGWRGNHYFLKSGFDPVYRQFSPGKLLMHLAIKNAFSADFARCELLGSDEPYKLAWANSCREKRLLNAFARTPSGSLDWASYAYARPLARQMLAWRPRRYPNAEKG
jgi:CelD/BcsL family acetyltransferase involved in cellulose biosynthesis